MKYNVYRVGISAFIESFDTEEEAQNYIATLPYDDVGLYIVYE